MTWLPAVSVIVTVLVAVIGLTRHISKKDSDVDAVKTAVIEVHRRIDKVESKADDNAKEVTGPVRITAATMAKDIAHVVADVADVKTMLTAHINEYRADQKGKRS